MKQINNLIQKYSITLLCGAFLGMSLPLLAMEPEEPDLNEIGMPNLASLYQELTEENKTSAISDAKKASLERLRKSGSQTMGSWHLEKSTTQQPTAREDEPVTQCSQPATHTFEHTITDAVIVPGSNNALISTHNTLHLFDTADNKVLKTVAFPRPIAKLIPSRNVNLCAVLLIPNKNEKPEIQFVNCSKNSLELNNKINPITYLRDNDYEIAQAAALSADGRWLATIKTNTLASIHNLTTNETFKEITKVAKYPIFSVDCLQNKMAVHANLETSLYSVSANPNECQLLRTIDHQALVPEIDYAARQGAWLVNDMVFVRIGNKVAIYNATGTLLQTFKVGKNNPIYPCQNDKHCFIELQPRKKTFCIHNLHMTAIPVNTELNVCKTTQTRILFDKSSEKQITLCAQNKTVVARNPNAQGIAHAKAITAQKKLALEEPVLPNTSILDAIRDNNAELVESLIKNEATMAILADKKFADAFKIAAFRGFATIIQTILATIPHSEQVKILQAKDALMVAYGLTRRNGIGIAQKEIRKMINQEFIRGLVAQQMERVEQMLAGGNNVENAYSVAQFGARIRIEAPRLVREGLVAQQMECVEQMHAAKSSIDDETAYDWAKKGVTLKTQGPQLVRIIGRPNTIETNPHGVIELLDPKNTALRAQLLEKSIRKILFSGTQGN